jgi:excisionase family DNA binding protein
MGIGRSTLYELIRSGALRTVRIGKRGVRIPSDEVLRFVAEQLEGD